MTRIVPSASFVAVAASAAAIERRGTSKKEIAQTLFVTIKTVEVHLSHAYRQLGISSRAQLDSAFLTTAPSAAPAPA